MLQLSVLIRYSHTLQILVVSDRLKVTADQKRIDLVTVSGLELLDMAVDRVELAMAASFYGNLAR
jgi:hypothetical protein